MDSIEAIKSAIEETKRIYKEDKQLQNDTVTKGIIQGLEIAIDIIDDYVFKNRLL